MNPGASPGPRPVAGAAFFSGPSPMHLIHIFLPLNDNKGQPLGRARFRTVAAELTEQFGGLSAAHALTRCRHPLNVPLGAERTAFPSMATCRSPAASHTPVIHPATHLPNACGSSRANTRLKVSWLGMPFGRARSPCSQPSLAFPNASTSSHESAPQMTAHRAITRMSPSECFFVRSMRGSGRSAK